MIQINFTSKGSMLKTTKATKIRILPIKMVDGRIEARKTEFIWVPNSAIIKIEGFCVTVKDWFLDINDDLKRIINENKDLQIIITGKNFKELADNIK